MQTFKELNKEFVYITDFTASLIKEYYLADLTVSKRPGTSNRIEIHFAVFNHLYLCLSFMKLAKTL